MVWRCSPRMSADITLIINALMHMPTAAAWWLKPSNMYCIFLWLLFMGLDIVHIGKVGYMNVGFNLSTWIILQGSIKNVVGYIDERGKGECKLCRIPERICKDMESPPLALPLTNALTNLRGSWGNLSAASNHHRDSAHRVKYRSRVQKHIMVAC